MQDLLASHSTRLGAATHTTCSGLVTTACVSPYYYLHFNGRDAERQDIDVPDPDYLREDARRAVLSARKAGIDVFAFALGNGSFRVLDRIVGEPAG